MKPIHILGLNCAYHESSACIVRDGELLSFTEEERWNRVKHAKPSHVDNADELPLASIDYCLREAQITREQIDHVAFNFVPEERLQHQIGIDGDHKIIPGLWGTEKGEQKFYISTFQ